MERGVVSVTLWLEVTPDKYELPLAVADSARELGKLRGKKPNTIMSCAGRVKAGKRKQSIYVKVEVEDVRD